MPTPGKRTLTEHLESGHDPKAALQTLKGRLDHPLQTVGDMVRDKVVDTITGSIEDFVNKLIDQLDGLAKTTISEGLKEANKGCPSQQLVDQIEGAINTRRMIAAFHMLTKIDKAVKGAIDALDGDGSDYDKIKAVQGAIDDMIKAMQEYADAIHKTNTEHQRLSSIAQRCPEQPKLDLRTFSVQKPFKKMSSKIRVPPSSDPVKPAQIIAVPGELTS